MVKVLMAASEGMPYAKTGGLADVIGSLPAALIREGIDARIIMPLYGSINTSLRESITHIGHGFVRIGWRNQYCGIESCEYKNIKYYFIDNEYYFKRQNLYGYDDEAERYTFFCRGVLESIPQLGFEPDIIHCHDWQSAMIPVFLDSGYRMKKNYKNLKTLFTIHNLKYQGVFQESILHDLLDIGKEYFTPEKLEFYGCVNFMKGGLVYSDYITTVSPSYSQEIQDSYFGEKLDGLLREKNWCLKGILNGIDYDEYNPSEDKRIYRCYNTDTLDDKVKNKLLFQKEAGIESSMDIPLIGIISRLYQQKGLDLIVWVMDEIVKYGAELAVLGTGDEKYEEFFNNAQKKYEGRVSSRISFDDAWAHRIYAASDIFLMPSEFEPCGLGQMIAMRYGALPIVHETGGLKDTVKAYNEFRGDGNGFSFKNNNAEDMLYTIKRALDFYKKKEVWMSLVKRAMESDLSWENSAKEYKMLYEKMIQREAADGREA
jgi:starch synthase